MDTFVRRIILILVVLALTVGIMPIVVSAQDSCDEGMSLFALNGAIFVADDGTSRSLTEGQMVIASAPNGDMVVVCLPDTGEIGQVTYVMLTTEPPESEESQPEVSAITGPVLDGDEHVCDVRKCSLDIGVNDYTDESDVAQIGFGWGTPLVSWDGHVTDGDNGFVTLRGGFYLDLALPLDGVVRIYNYPQSWTEEQLQQFIAQIQQEAFGGAEGVDYVEWDSEVESLNASAMGDEGVGPGDLYPQLDGQQYSCPPEKGTCIRNVVVAEERQVALVFGMQIDYQNLHGAHSDDPQESVRLPENRCDIVVLPEGTYNNLEISDGRVEVYNVPLFDQSGWFRNLVVERVQEQADHYGCPEHQFVPIWNADGTMTQQFELHWQTDPPTAEGPVEIATS